MKIEYNIPTKKQLYIMKPLSNVIDRIDTTKGYIKGNIQVVSHKANFIKTNLTLDELANFIKNISKMYK